MRYYHNPDFTIRQLERMALQGDKMAIRRLAAIAMRMTLPEDKEEKIADILWSLEKQVKDLINCISYPFKTSPRNADVQLCKKDAYYWWDEQFPELDPNLNLILQAQVSIPGMSTNVHTATVYIMSSGAEDLERAVVTKIVNGTGIVPLEELAKLFYETGYDANSASIKDLHFELEIAKTHYLGVIDDYQQP